MTTSTGKGTSRVTGSELLSEVVQLARELKTPVINEPFAVLGDQARSEGWSHEEYLAAVLGRQVASRTANGTRMRIAAAHEWGRDHPPAPFLIRMRHLYPSPGQPVPTGTSVWAFHRFPFLQYSHH